MMFYADDDKLMLMMMVSVDVRGKFHGAHDLLFFVFVFAYFTKF